MSALLPSNRDYLLRARPRKGRAVYDDRDRPLDVEPNGRRKAFWRCDAAGIAATSGGRWTRSMLPNADGPKLHAGVGSSSNIAENGMEAEENRAAIYEIDLASGGSRIFTSGLRNAVGMAWGAGNRRPLDRSEEANRYRNKNSL